MTLPRPAALLLAAAWAVGASPAPGGAQQAVDVPGVVLDRETGKGIPDVVLRIQGTPISAVTGGDGGFVLRDVAVGSWTLEVEHLAYGVHQRRLALEAGRSAELVVRLTPTAIELEEVLVEVPGVRTIGERSQGVTNLVVDRAQIERTIASSRHLGDFLRQAVPGIRVRQSNAFEDADVCIEFRASGTVSLMRRGCNHPMVFLDGVPIGNPQALYGSLGLQNVERIEVIPPGAAGARYGSGSLFGVILIETRPPGRDRGVPAGPRVPATPFDLRGSGNAFDWNRDPQGHDFWRTSAGAFVGNALGLAAGVAIGSRCIGISDEHEIETRCSFAGDAVAGLAAMAFPAVGASLGARWGGATALSRGRTLPAVLGAGLMLFPGYAFSMATVGGGSHAANAAGAVMLVVGTPLFVSLADRLFRDLR